MMKKFTKLRGLVAPMDRADVDTDAIIPKQYLKSIVRSGFGVTLFDDWRYLDPGQPGMDHGTRRTNPDFVLNQLRYAGASILLARENFGCGSSREHAVWALDEFGFAVVIAPSFADIFFNNCFKSGLLPIVLDKLTVDQLMKATLANEDYRLEIDLEKQTITTPDGENLSFEVDTFRKHCLLEGLDDIGTTLKHTEEIRAYEKRHRERSPWLFS
jgi:3-isopropylmalate/(R)-2-methylmalate dehydratase small subunit